MGKQLLGLVLLVLLAAGSLGHVPKVFLPGKHYHYEYETLVRSLLPELDDDQYAGHWMTCDVHIDVIQDHVIHMKFENLRFSKVHEHEDLPHEDAKFTPLRMPQDFVQDLLRPCKVVFKDGMVDVHHLNQEESHESGNLKRAVLQMLQVPHEIIVPYLRSLNTKTTTSWVENTYTDFEDGLLGNCETDYEVVEAEDFFQPEVDSLYVTKVRNYLNCTSVQRWEHSEYDHRGCERICEDTDEGEDDCKPGCPYGYTQNVSPVRNFGVTKYNISLHHEIPVVHEIYHEGKISYDIHGDTFAILTNQTLQLVTINEIRQPIPEPRTPEVHESLEYHVDDEDEKRVGDIHMPFYHLFTEQIKEQDSVQRMVTLVKYIADVIYPETQRDREHRLLGTHVVRAVQTLSVMTRQELAQVHAVFVRRSNEVERLYWKVFMEILAEAKSQEVALFVHDLIASKELKESRVVDLLTSLPMSVVDPDTKLVDKYMNLLEKMHHESEYIRNHLSIAVAKLIKRTCVRPEDTFTTEEDFPQEQTYSHHPEEFLIEKEGLKKNTYNRRGLNKYTNDDEDECDEKDLFNYIKKLQTILEDERDIPSLVNYIETLSQTGSIEVLPFLMPYITEENRVCQESDEEDDDDCRYLRTIAIYSLHHLTFDDTDKILDVVEPIFFTPSEDPRIRIAAFSVFLVCDPPLRHLQRVATELDFENYDHVGSYVYSAMKHMGNSSLPCFQKIAMKIQKVFAHLPEEYDNGIHLATYYKDSVYDEEDDFGFMHLLTYVPNDDSHHLESGQFKIMTNMANLIATPLKVRFNVKGLDQLLSKWESVLTHKQNSWTGRSEYMNKLNIKPREPEDFQLRLKLKLFERTYHYIYDEKHIDWLVSKMYKLFNLPTQVAENQKHLLKILMPLDHTVIMPTHMGFPARLSTRRPTILYAKVEYAVKGHNSVYIKVYPKIHHESNTRAYIVHPETEEVCGVASKNIYHLSIPFEMELTMNMEDARFEMVFRPKVPHQVFYHISNPYTYTIDNLMTHPVGLEITKDFQPIRQLDEPAEFFNETGHEIFGMGLRTHIKSDSPFSGLPIFWDDTAEEDGILAAIVEAYRNPGLEYREVKVILEHDDDEPIDEYHVAFKYNYNPVHQKHDNSYEKEYHQDATYHTEFQHPKMQYRVHPATVQRNPMTWTGVKGGKSPVEIPAETKIAHEVLMTVAGKGPQTHYIWEILGRYTYNYDETHHKVVAYAKKTQTGSYHRDEDMKVCFFYNYLTTPIPDEFHLDLKSFQDMEGKIVAGLNWGKNCEGRPNIKVEGELSKDDEWYKDVTSTLQPWYYKTCLEDIKNGDSLSDACELARDDASEFDNLELDIHYNEKEIPDWMADYTYDFMVYLKQAFYQNLNQTIAVDNTDGHIKVLIDLDEIQVPVMNLTIITPDEEMSLENVGIEMIPIPSGLNTIMETLVDDWTDGSYPALCTVSEDYVTTFDNVTFEMEDTQCEYLLAADCSGEDNIAISYKEVDHAKNSKVLRIVLGPHHVELYPMERSDNCAHINVNGETWEVCEGKIVRPCIQDNCIVIRVPETLSPQTRPIVVVEDDDTDFSILFNGIAAKIYAPISHQGVQCGICGEFNDEEYLDFVGPQECVFEDSEDFVKSYIYPGSCNVDSRPEGRTRCPQKQQHKRFNPVQKNIWQQKYSREHTYRPSTWTQREHHGMVNAWTHGMEPTYGHKMDWMNKQHNGKDLFYDTVYGNHYGKKYDNVYEKVYGKKYDTVYGKHHEGLYSNIHGNQMYGKNYENIHGKNVYGDKFYGKQYETMYGKNYDNVYGKNYNVYGKQFGKNFDSVHGYNKYDTVYGKHHDNKYDTIYGKHHDSKYDTVYGKHHDNKYDTIYGKHHDNKYDTVYGKHHDNKYDTIYGKHHENKYDTVYGKHHDNKYEHTYGKKYDNVYGKNIHHNMYEDQTPFMKKDFTQRQWFQQERNTPRNIFSDKSHKMDVFYPTTTTNSWNTDKWTPRYGQKNVHHYVPTFETSRNTYGHQYHQVVEGQCFEHVTIVEEQQEAVCFSLRPHKVCRKPSECTSFVQREVQFHCVPRGTPEAKLLRQKVHQQGFVRPETLGHPQVHYQKTIRVPTECKTRY